MELKSGIEMKPPERQSVIGRPTVCTPEVVKKLEDAFAMDCTIEEACFYANISRTTYYAHIERHPEIIERFEELRNKPILLARQTIINNLSNIDGAKWYIERKRKKEFSIRQEHTGADGDAIQHEVVTHSESINLLKSILGKGK